MRYFVKRHTKLLAINMVVILSLAGCGGGGSDAGEILTAGTVSLSARATSATAIALSWTAPSGGVSVSPYAVARNDDQSTSTIGSTDSLSFNVAGLTPGTRYCFVIRNPLTGNIMSNTACATTLADSDAPTTPEGLTANALSPAEVSLAWNLASDNDRVAGYNVYRDGVLIQTVSAVVTTDIEAAPATTHCYRVTAFDAAGNESDASAEICATTPADTQDPTVPVDVTASFSEVAGQSVIVVSWTASTDDGLVRFYKVHRDGVYVADAADTSYEDPGLAPDTTYCYTISAVDAAAKESGLSEPGCAREGWRKQNFDATNTLASAVAVDTGDTVHIAFKQRLFDSVSNEIRIPLSYVRLEPGQTPSRLVLEEGGETFFFTDAYRLAIVADSNNFVHLAHKVNKALVPEQVQYLQISAGSTVSGTVQESDSAMDSISVAVDDLGAIHACYGLSGTLFYASNASGVWVSTDTSTLLAGAAGMDCDIAIDGNNSVHISFLENQSRDLMYLSNRSGSWVVERLDQHSVSQVNTSHNTSIDVDENGNAHIAYFHDFADNDLEYATNASGIWTTQKLDSEGDVGYDCEIAVDSLGFVHIVYRDKTGSTMLKYASNKTGNWLTDFLSTAGTGDISIAIDSLDKVHVSYTDADGQAAYMTNRN